MISVPHSARRVGHHQEDSKLIENSGHCITNISKCSGHSDEQLGNGPDALSHKMASYFPPTITLSTAALTPLCFNWMRASVEVSN